jgi:hypothetical protein
MQWDGLNNCSDAYTASDLIGGAWAAVVAEMHKDISCTELLAQLVIARKLTVPACGNSRCLEDFHVQNDAFAKTTGSGQTQEEKTGIPETIAAVFSPSSSTFNVIGSLGRPD